MVGQKLLVVGGVWMFSEGVPGLAVIDLATCTSVEFSLDTVSERSPQREGSGSSGGADVGVCVCRRPCPTL